jgi:hypothetical protein
MLFQKLLPFVQIRCGGLLHAPLLCGDAFVAKLDGYATLYGPAVSQMAQEG